MSKTLSQTLSTTAPIMSAQLMASPAVTIAGNGSIGGAMASANILSQTLSQTLSSTPLQTQSSSSTAALTPQTPSVVSQPDADAAKMSSESTATTGVANVSVTQSSTAAIKNPVVILDKTRLQELVQEVDPNEQLEDDVEDMLLTIADEFIESLVYTSTLFAKHRKSSTLDVKDVQLALEKNWKMWIPGFGATDDSHRQHKKSFSTEAHKQRMALIKKTLKKL